MAHRHLRLNAYILASDPWWPKESEGSYYDLMDRIVVAYDRDGTSWTGTPLPVEECLERLRSINVDDKCDYRPGHYARLDCSPLKSDTHQRPTALSQASDSSDWVVQLDSDKVLQDPEVFRSCLQEADGRAATGLEFLARNLYARTRLGEFLEMSSRPWSRIANRPAPLAVVSGAIPPLPAERRYWVGES